MSLEPPAWFFHQTGFMFSEKFVDLNSSRSGLTSDKRRLVTAMAAGEGEKHCVFSRHKS
jgi:hypothetical protein